jgi:hypothetical protein
VNGLWSWALFGTLVGNIVGAMIAGFDCELARSRGEAFGARRFAFFYGSQVVLYAVLGGAAGYFATAP